MKEELSLIVRGGLVVGCVSPSMLSGMSAMPDGEYILKQQSSRQVEGLEQAMFAVAHIARRIEGTVGVELREAILTLRAALGGNREDERRPGFEHHFLVQLGTTACGICGMTPTHHWHVTRKP